MTTPHNLLANLDNLNAAQLRRQLSTLLTQQKLGLYWESSAIERDAALNANIVLPRLVEENSHGLEQLAAPGSPNLIIEGDNFDSLRLLKSTHAGKIRVIYIDPPYNTGNKDWVYNDRYVGQNDRWRHSQWLEFLHSRLTLAKDLLTQDGVIMVSINDENRARLELLMDEVFPNRRIGSFVWRVRSGGNDTKGALLSDNHEHVLVYGNAGFEFKGEGRDETAYENSDNDPRGEWSSGDLNKAHSAKQRPEAYYSIHNAETDTWYACDPDSVWRFSSTTRPLKKKLQSDPIETILAEKRILWPGNDKTVTYASTDEILKAIKQGTAPKQLKIYAELKQLAKAAESDNKVARLLTYIEPLESWVGRKIGYGKPRYKRFRSQLLRDVTPLSSWLHAAAQSLTEDDEDDDVVSLTVGATGEGTSQVKALLGNKDFPYPKPLSLLLGLLTQAARPNDTILDFFAGTGTTAHAVLALNAMDGGNRKFILCSSTEATDKEPDKNVCRDVCANRIRKVIESDAALSNNSFAYLQLDKIAPGDAPFESDCAHAFQLLTLRLGKVARPVPKADKTSKGIKILLQSSADGSLTVMVHHLTPATLDALATLPLSPNNPRLGHLRVYSSRPDTVREHLTRVWEGTDKTVESLSLQKALLHGQIAPRRKARVNVAKAAEIATNNIAT
jgi:adenine-specific DNA-methyltransferase